MFLISNRIKNSKKKFTNNFEQFIELKNIRLKIEWKFDKSISIILDSFTGRLCYCLLEVMLHCVEEERESTYSHSHWSWASETVSRCSATLYKYPRSTFVYVYKYAALNMHIQWKNHQHLPTQESGDIGRRWVFVAVTVDFLKTTNVGIEIVLSVRPFFWRS